MKQPSAAAWARAHAKFEAFVFVPAVPLRHGHGKLVLGFGWEPVDAQP